MPGIFNAAFEETAEIMPPFAGLLEADFDAYLPARATSNAFVRPRLAVKQKLLEQGRELATRAVAAGLSLDVSASDERPSVWNRKRVTEQWVFLARDRAERERLEKDFGGDRSLEAAFADPTPYYRHAFLGLRLDAERFEVALRIHRDARADVLQLRRQLESDAGRAQLAHALEALPEGFVAGAAGRESVPAHGVDAARIATLLDAASSAGSWLFVARPLEREACVREGAALEATIRAAFDALVPLYALFAWQPERVDAAVTEGLARERAARTAQHAEAAARDAAWYAQHDAAIAQRREQATSETRERVLALVPARPAAVQAAVARALTPRPSQRLQTPRAPVAPHAGPPPSHAGSAAPHAGSAAPTEWIESGGAPAIGTHVRIRSGHFAGRVGTVVALDARGEARVALGMITTRIEPDQLVAVVAKP